ncbi:hypothetical protein NJC10_03600 [Micrococcus sp. M4NT]|uniref:hypothetical protein n=1 Tax=Micrococcus sp. M4NT TaxID=2957501 RepID=UPI0029B34BD2|nr:hypothetical protein [Micrococcus sp. M4NT]MDX2340764.1 hypothetical protein [Micrococcus sp. M4NT]
MSGPTGVDVLYDRLRADLPPLAAELQAMLGPAWTVTVDVAGPHPTVRLERPSQGGGRPVAAWVTPVRCRADRFHATAGVVMAPGEVAAPPPDDDAATAWIDALRRVGEAAEAACAPDGPVRISRSAGGGRIGAARAKADAARRHGLPLRWAKGWPEDVLGVRTEPVAGEELAPFLRDLCRILPQLAVVADGRIAP